MENKFEIKDKYLYFSLVIFGVYFIFRLIDQSQLLYTFPFDKTNDVAPYMTMLYFLANYGYHQIIPNWQNGFVLFQLYPPGWFYFALPIYLLTNSVLVATYSSLILMFVIIFLTIFYFGMKTDMSITKRIVFFLFLFTNPIAIGNFIRLSRVTELFGWMFFIILSFLFLIYKDRKFDNKFVVIFLFAYSLLMLSHPAIMVLSPIILVSLFLVKKLRERIILIAITLISFIITSFWWFFSFINNLSSSTINNEVITKGLIKFDFQWLWTSVTALIIPVIFFVIFYYYWKSKEKSKKELLFFLPILILNFLVLSRLIIFIPFFNNIFPDIYLIMFLFFSIYCFLNSNKVYPSILRNIVIILLVISPLVSISISHFKTPYFEDRLDVHYDAIEILSFVDDKFFIAGDIGMWIEPKKFYTSLEYAALYDYGIIFYDLETASAVQVLGSSSESYLDSFRKTRTAFSEERCDDFLNGLNILGATNVISYNEQCEILNKCGLKEVAKKGQVCLFKL